MPEYLAPGVYVEEVSFRSKSIEGVSTTTTGFIGPARYGPTDLTPDIVTSLGVEVFADQGSATPGSDRWSLGSGFIVRAQRVLTCAHVIGRASPTATAAYGRAT